MKLGHDPIDELDEKLDLPPWAAVLFVVLLVIGVLGNL